MSPLLWIGFLAIVVVLLTIDLRVTGAQDHALTTGEALSWTAFYVLLALLFNVAVFYVYEAQWLGAGVDEGGLTGREAAVQFFTAWLIEKSLSVDNIFVIALVFTHFGIGRREQHRVLFWGILGAVVFRGILILAGSELLEEFEWTAYVFGAVLILTAVRMLVVRHDNIEPEKSWIVRLARRRFPLTDGMRGEHFFVRENGHLLMTPLFLALLVVEGFDLLFAVDSVPAALAVTTDPFLVFTSNIFAILGLRALYFVLAGYMESLRYLKISLVFLISYVGVKLILSHTHPIPNVVSLAVIVVTLFVGVAASLLVSEDTAALVSPIADDLEELGEVTLRHIRKVVLFVVGSTVALLGLILVATPVPGTPVALAGLAILAVEFEWARRWLARTRAAIEEVEDVVREHLGLDDDDEATRASDGDAASVDVAAGGIHRGRE